VFWFRRATEPVIRHVTESEIRYRRLFESAQDGVLILDAETGTIVDVNPFLVELLGYSRDAFLGKKIWELGFLKDLFANQVNFTELQKKEYIRYEDLPLETSDGRRIEVEFVSNVYLVDQQKVIQCNIRDISQRKLAETQLRALVSRLRAVREEERIGLARVLHDDLGQALTALKLDLGWIEKRMSTSDQAVARTVSPRTAALRQLADGMLGTVQRISAELRPAGLDTMGLSAALSWHCGQFRERTGLEVDLALPAADPSLDPARAAALFHICQEALTNVARHAAARRVTVRLAVEGAAVVLQVCDDGRGITREQLEGPGALGLLGMREWVQPLGGMIEMQGRPGQGTRVTVRVPVRASAALRAN
jgi:PAS domain S-box-containing protein